MGWICYAEPLARADMRLFVGIPLPEATRTALAEACRDIRAADSGWADEKWVAAENLHITLAFLGDVPTESIALLARSITSELGAVRAFDLPLARLEPIPGARRASMLWARYDDPEGRWAALSLAVHGAAAAIGDATDNRAFKTHVTLARARRPRPITENLLGSLHAARDRVPKFVSVLSATLFSSTLTTAGPRYERLETWDFPS